MRQIFANTRNHAQARQVTLDAHRLVMDAFETRSAEIEAADGRTAEAELETDESGLMQLMKFPNFRKTAAAFRTHWRQVRTLNLDLKYYNDTKRKQYVGLNVVCTGTSSQVVAPVRTTDAEDVGRKFVKHGIMHYDHDQGGEFQGRCISAQEQFSIESKVTAAHAGGQLAVAERAGGIHGVAQAMRITAQGALLSTNIQDKLRTLTRAPFTANRSKDYMSGSLAYFRESKVGSQAGGKGHALSSVEMIRDRMRQGTLSPGKADACWWLPS